MNATPAESQIGHLPTGRHAASQPAPTPLRAVSAAVALEPATVRSTNFCEIWYPRCGHALKTRWLRPTDRKRVADAFDALSAGTRRNRCFGPKNGLSDRELEFFTRFEPGIHAALCAVRWNEVEAAEAEGVAAVRYVRDSRESECAEVALTVVDEWQGRGIATRLTSQLLAVLPTYGITAIRLHWFRHNEPVERLIQRLLGNGQRHSENGVITGEFRINSQRSDAA